MKVKIFNKNTIIKKLKQKHEKGEFKKYKYYNILNNK